MNINDTGSGAELMGYKTFQWLKLMRPSCVTQRDVPLKTSLRSIAGIGGVNNVMFWCQITLDFGGQPLKYDDIAILRHHDGILLGNDTLAQGRACICYGDQQTTASGVVCDGTVRLRDKDGNFISDPVPFSTRRNTPGHCFALQGDFVQRLQSAYHDCKEGGCDPQPASADACAVTSARTSSKTCHATNGRISILAIDSAGEFVVEGQAGYLALPAVSFHLADSGRGSVRDIAQAYVRK